MARASQIARTSSSTGKSNSTLPLDIDNSFGLGDLALLRVVLSSISSFSAVHCSFEVRMIVRYRGCRVPGCQGCYGNFQAACAKTDALNDLSSCRNAIPPSTLTKDVKTYCTRHSQNYPVSLSVLGSCVIQDLVSLDGLSISKLEIHCIVCIVLHTLLHTITFI